MAHKVVNLKNVFDINIFLILLVCVEYWYILWYTIYYKFSMIGDGKIYYCN